VPRRLLSLLLLVVLVPPAAAAVPRSRPAERGGTWLLRLVGNDGALRALDGQPDYGGTITVGLALAASGTGRVAFSRSVAFVAAHVDDYVVRNGVDRPGALGRVALLFAAAGRDAGPLADRILVTRQAVGPYAGQLADPENPGNFAHALGLLGVAAAGPVTPARREAVDAAVAYLKAQQCDDGGWPLAARVVVAGTAPVPCGVGAKGPDSNTTAVAMSALRALGAVARVEPRSWLAVAQNADGGFGYFPGDVTDADSTALVVQALVAVGSDPARFHKEDGSAYGALMALQLPCSGPDAGAWAYQRPASGPLRANAFATGEAVPAAARVAFPLRKASFRVSGAGPACNR
jgi:hypothetical protein